MRHQNRNSFRWAIVIPAVVSLCLTACAEKGAELFKTEGCAVCHSFKGKGGGMAPDLTAVANRRSDAWIRQQIKHPQKNKRDSRMPPFEHLSEWEVRSIIRYLKS